jgi:hypothetical protein
MVCYSSMSPLPSSASILCSASSSFNFYALLFFLLRSTPPVVQLLFCLLCYVLPLHPLHCATDLPFRLCTVSHPTHMHHSRETLCLFSILHVFHTSSHLPDHHANSSSSLAIIQGSLASLAVILRIFCFSVSRNSSSSLAVTTSHFFWLLWLLSPFLHVTSGGDHMPIQKVLHVLGLASTSSLFSI